MDKTVRKILSVVVASWALCQTTACQAAPDKQLQAAINDYHAHNFGAAIGKLQSANQKDPLTHYYLALSYQALSRISDAETEYLWGYRNSKDAALRYKSWQGLQGLARLKPAYSARSQAGTAYGAGSAGGATGDNGAGGVSLGAPKLPSLSSYKAERTFKASEPQQTPQVNFKFTPGCPRHR